MRARGVAAIVVACLVGFGIWAVFIWRARNVNLASAQLCGVIAQIVAGSDASLGQPGSPGYVYYRAHPDELRAAHRANRAVLKSLPCKPPKEKP